MDKVIIPIPVLLILAFIYAIIMPMFNNIPDVNIKPFGKAEISLYAESAASDLSEDIRASDQAHANMRHGFEADLARECSKRPDHIFYNPDTHRTAYLCVVSDLFGFHILDSSGNEVTAFLKNKFHNFSQVLKYMQNSGYGLLH